MLTDVAGRSRGERGTHELLVHLVLLVLVVVLLVVFVVVFFVIVLVAMSSHRNWLNVVIWFSFGIFITMCMYHSAEILVIFVRVETLAEQI